MFLLLVQAGLALATAGLSTTQPYKIPYPFKNAFEVKSRPVSGLSRRKIEILGPAHADEEDLAIALLYNPHLEAKPVHEFNEGTKFGVFGQSWRTIRATPHFVGRDVTAGLELNGNVTLAVDVLHKSLEIGTDAWFKERVEEGEASLETVFLMMDWIDDGAHKADDESPYLVRK